MIEVAAGPWQLALLPERGAAMARLRHRGRDLIEPLPEGADPNRTPAGAFLMLPWANRLADGLLSLPDSGAHRFPINRPDENNAIHGLSRDRPWTVAATEAAGEARLKQSLDEGPYAYDAALDVRALPDALRLTLAVTSRAAAPVPYGMGWHPFFRRPAGARVGFRAASRLVVDARGLPLRSERSQGMEDADPVGQDTHYAGWDGTALLRLGALDLQLRAEGAWARNLQVYAPASRAVLAVEPVSHAPDAANRPWLGEFGSMTVLRSGETLTGSVELRVIG